jgi:anthranilate synthase/aminodeoxychorismate synthase-like glutamine amidotransferase
MPSSILLIDNYDSFVFNLERYVRELGPETCVVRNDAVTVEEIRRMHPAAVILSPGPGIPQRAGICEAVVRELGAEIPILGVCLGHQAIATALGGQVVQTEPMHGRTSLVEHDGDGLYAHCENPLRVTRYHSLIVDEDSLPAALRVTARTREGIVMGISHREWPLHGVQFHPESVLTRHGHQLLANFLKRAGLTELATILSEELPVAAEDESDFFLREIDADAQRPA